MQPGSTELWKVVNACADTLMNLALEYDGVAQDLQLIAMDGFLYTGGGPNTQRSIMLPTAARAEFLVAAPGPAVKNATLVTLYIDMGPVGDSVPRRPLITVTTSPNATAPALRVPAPGPGPAPEEHLAIPDLVAMPVNVSRNLYFSEVLSDPSDSDSPTNFYITVRGAKPTLFSMRAGPSIVVTQGAVEDWTIENRAQEHHVFHIHQIHFIVTETDGVVTPADQLQYLDTVQIPFWSGSGPYPYVKIRMAFPPLVTGEFVYHCHIIGHEDSGMMAKVLVAPPGYRGPEQGTTPPPLPGPDGRGSTEAWMIGAAVAIAAAATFTAVTVACNWNALRACCCPGAGAGPAAAYKAPADQPDDFEAGNVRAAAAAARPGNWGVGGEAPKPAAVPGRGRRGRRRSSDAGLRGSFDEAANALSAAVRGLAGGGADKSPPRNSRSRSASPSMARGRAVDQSQHVVMDMSRSGDGSGADRKGRVAKGPSGPGEMVATLTTSQWGPPKAEPPQRLTPASGGGRGDRR